MRITALLIPTDGFIPRPTAPSVGKRGRDAWSHGGTKATMHDPSLSLRHSIAECAVGVAFIMAIKCGDTAAGLSRRPSLPLPPDCRTVRSVRDRRACVWRLHSISDFRLFCDNWMDGWTSSDTEPRCWPAVRQESVQRSLSFVSPATNDACDIFDVRSRRTCRSGRTAALSTRGTSCTHGPSLPQSSKQSTAHTKSVDVLLLMR